MKALLLTVFFGLVAAALLVPPGADLVRAQAPAGPQGGSQGTGAAQAPPPAATTTAPQQQQKPQDAGASTDNFERIDASFALVRQVIAASALSLHSSDVDLVGQGTLTIPTKALDGQMDLSLSEALSARAGTDLARFTREGNRILLPAVIGGTLDAPHVTIDAGAAVRRGLRNEVQRRLKDILGGLVPAPLD